MFISSANVSSDIRTHRARLIPALAGMILGLVILFGAAFAEQPLHNAAHDSRHSFSFACH